MLGVRSSMKISSPNLFRVCHLAKTHIIGLNCDNCFKAYTTLRLFSKFNPQDSSFYNKGFIGYGMEAESSKDTVNIWLSQDIECVLCRIINITIGPAKSRVTFW